MFYGLHRFAKFISYFFNRETIHHIKIPAGNRLEPAVFFEKVYKTENLCATNKKALLHPSAR